ncbi:MAG: DNA recombination protein RmuC [Pirellulaceae bacterium]
MADVLLIVVLVMLAVVIVLEVLLFCRKVSLDLSPVQQAFEGVEKSHERTERVVRDEIAKNREESSVSARQTRQEMGITLKGVGDSLDKQLLALTRISDQKLGTMRDTVEERLTALQEGNAKKLDEIRCEATLSSQKSREEVSKTVNDFVTWQRDQFAGVIDQLTKLTESNETRLESVKTTVEEKLHAMQEDNTKKLEQIRETVDEKLQGTIERRLGESFKLVSERLEQVHKGLGEMQVLATGVGDLKRVLTNVKTRGTWGEVQLGMMLEEVLAPDQYETNVATKDGSERVEFAIRLPGRGGDKDEIVWLPIDAKFPTEDYQRLVEAQEQGDSEAMEAASKQLENRIKGCAGDICGKYVNPPKTTDFGVLFLPTEGLFAEVIRRPGLVDMVQRKYRVVIAGPTTLWSILNSLQMGFRTLAIEQRSSEVWNLLAAVKTEFGKYGDVLAKVQKKLQEAATTVDKVAVRSRAIQRQLRDVEELPAPGVDNTLLLADVGGDEDAEEVDVLEV